MTRNCVCFPDAVPEPLPHGLQQQVSGVMSERVIDELEMVQVGEQDGEDCATLFRIPDCLMQALEQLGAVRQAGQRIMECLMAQLLLIDQPLVLALRVDDLVSPADDEEEKEVA